MKIEKQQIGKIILNKLETPQKNKIKNIDRKNTANKTQEDNYVDVELQDNSINTNALCDKHANDTRSDEEKFETAKAGMESTINDFKALQNEFWTNYPELYSNTKDFDGVMSLGYTSNGITSYEDTIYKPELDFSHFYSNDYPTISSIAAGTEKPWENVTTKKEAVELINKILDEATGNNEHTGITAGENINQGEYAVIQTVLSELSKINEDTKEVADTCLKKLQEAAEKTYSLDSIIETYNEIPKVGDQPKPPKEILMENFNTVEYNFEIVTELRENFEKTRANMENKPKTQNNMDMLQKAYFQYQTAFKRLVEAGGLDYGQITSSDGISSYNINVHLIKSELDDILYDGNTTKQ